MLRDYGTLVWEDKFDTKGTVFDFKSPNGADRDGSVRDKYERLTEASEDGVLDSTEKTLSVGSGSVAYYSVKVVNAWTTEHRYRLDSGDQPYDATLRLTQTDSGVRTEIIEAG